MKTPTILVTGAAGFIGSSLSEVLLKNYHVIGIDNFYPNYSFELKKLNIGRLSKHKRFEFYELDICDRKKLKTFFSSKHIDKIIHLAALTGVRASLSNPELYRKVNVLGTHQLAEISALTGIKQFIFTSSSSVYGNSQEIPFKESAPLAPRSPYAQSKQKAEEVLQALQNKYHIPTTILRLFSVYGPNGRPDMAPYLFTEAAFLGKKIQQFGKGTTARDYTYIDDVVKAFQLALNKPLLSEIINIGNSSPEMLVKLSLLVEKYTGKKLNKQLKPLIPNESKITYANITKAKKLIGWSPQISFTQGMQKFIEWYKKNRLLDL